MPLHLLLAHQALSVVNHLFQAPLPEPALLFPWLYAGPSLSIPQNLKSFVLFVRSCPIVDFSVPIIADSGILKNTVHYSQILARVSGDADDGSYISVVASEEHRAQLRNFITNFLLYLDIIPDENDPYVDTVLHDVLKVGHLPIFRDVSSELFSIRSFNMQVHKISTISDFIVYCFNESHEQGMQQDTDIGDQKHSSSRHSSACKCLAVARLLHLAQIYLQKSSPPLSATAQNMTSDTASQLNAEDTFTPDSNIPEEQGSIDPNDDESNEQKSIRSVLSVDHCGELQKEEDNSDDEIDFTSVLKALKQNEKFTITENEDESDVDDYNSVYNFKKVKKNDLASSKSPLSTMIQASEEAAIAIIDPLKYFHNQTLSNQDQHLNKIFSFYNTFIIRNPLEILTNDKQFEQLISILPYAVSGEELSINSMLASGTPNSPLTRAADAFARLIDPSSAVPFASSPTSQPSTAGFLSSLLTNFEINSLKNWEMNYAIKEKFEIWKISSAQQFQPGIWLGNEGDYFMWKQLNYSQTAFSTPSSASNIATYEDKVPRYCSVHNSIFFEDVPFIKQGYDNNTFLNKIDTNWRFLIEVHASSKFPSPQKLQEVFGILQKYQSIGPTSFSAQELPLITLSFPASGTISGLGDLSIESILLIINMCKILHTKNHVCFPTLVFCPEGYTETSLLAVIYLIYVTGQTLQDVIIDLYMKYGRPFYLFDNDYKLLRTLEPILLHYSQKHGVTSNMKNLGSSQFDYEQNQISNELEEPSVENNETISEILYTKVNVPTSRFGVAVNSFNHSLCEDRNQGIIKTSGNWFNDLIQHNNASLIPSRILPNMFLGCLNHANSLPLLSKLKISTIVSVGETLSWLGKLPADSYTINNAFGSSGACHVISFKVNSLALKIPSLERFPVKHILLINDIKDDGIDSISNELLNDIFTFFQTYTKTDIDSIINVDLADKVLVHCKVGVSRSASVVIAYMMRFLGMTLEKAYLFVRVRRLNIIIQPNLRLFYGLFKIQEELLTRFYNTHEEVYRQKLLDQEDNGLFSSEGDDYDNESFQERVDSSESRGPFTAKYGNTHNQVYYRRKTSFSSVPSSGGFLVESANSMNSDNAGNSCLFNKPGLGNNGDSTGSNNNNSVFVSERKKSSVSSSFMDNSSMYSHDFYTSAAGNSIVKHRKLHEARVTDGSSASSLQTSITFDSDDSDDLTNRTLAAGDGNMSRKVSAVSTTTGTVNCSDLRKNLSSWKSDTASSVLRSLFSGDSDSAHRKKLSMKWLRNVDWVVFCQQVHELNRF